MFETINYILYLPVYIFQNTHLLYLHELNVTNNEVLFWRDTLAGLFSNFISETGHSWPKGDFMMAKDVKFIFEENNLGLVEQAVGRWNKNYFFIKKITI